MALEKLVDIDRCMLVACYGSLLLLKNKRSWWSVKHSFWTWKSQNSWVPLWLIMWRNPQEEAEQMSSSRISHEINQPASLGYPPIQCKVTNHPSLPGSAMMIWINGPILRLSGHLPGMPRGTNVQWMLQRDRALLRRADSEHARRRGDTT